jgi:hypothetical protein
MVEYQQGKGMENSPESPLAGVWITTPTRVRKQAASVFIPVRVFTILAPPVINCDVRLPCLSIRER